MDFDKIAKENISSDNILDFADKSTDDVEGSEIATLKEDCHVEGVVEMAKSQDLGTVASKKDVTMEQDCSTNEVASKGMRLQSTPKYSKTKSQEQNICNLSRKISMDLKLPRRLHLTKPNVCHARAARPMPRP